MGKGHLCYLWFGNGVNINELGMNFDNDYYFTMSKNGNEYEIKKTQRDATLPTNFFGENISSLATIVGENGLGKTSNLRFLINNLLVETSTNREYYVAVFK